RFFTLAYRCCIAAYTFPSTTLSFLILTPKWVKHGVSGDTMDPFLLQEQPSYTAYRQRFLDIVAQRSGVVQHYEHPLTGRDGETLYTDVARFGRPDAKKWLISISG